MQESAHIAKDVYHKKIIYIGGNLKVKCGKHIAMVTPYKNGFIYTIATRGIWDSNIYWSESVFPLRMIDLIYEIFVNGNKWRIK